MIKCSEVHATCRVQVCNIVCVLYLEGICGSPQLADVGGVPYLFPVAQKDKVGLALLCHVARCPASASCCLQKYDLSNVATSVGLPAALVIGAGAGSSQFVGVNCELIPNLWVSMDAEQQVNRSYAVRTVPDVS